MEVFPCNIDFDKERYTIPEVITILGKAGDIPGHDDKSSRNYKTMYQSLRRTLLLNVDNNKIEGSPRKRTFPKREIIRAINEQAKLFRKLSPKETSPAAYWSVEAKEYRQKVLELLKEDTPNPEESQDDGGCQEYVRDVLKMMKERIVWDFFTCYCFDFETSLLEHDLECEFTFDDLNPTPEGMEAIQRLEDLRNYYKLKPKFVASQRLLHSAIVNAEKKRKAAR